MSAVEGASKASRITEVVVAAAVMIMVAVVSAVVRRWDSHVKRSFFSGVNGGVTVC